MAMDVVDYEIHGGEMQFVEVELDPGEAAVGEAGSMIFMDAGIGMDTVFGDGSGGGGGGLFGKLLGAGKRLVTGESLFTTVYTNQGQRKARVAFAAPYPGKILPMDLSQLGGMLICQKDAFLCAARGVSLGIFFQRKLSVGFFGGEGFIMQKLEGNGLAFVHAGGTVVKRELTAGETLMVDTGCLVAMTPNVNFEIQYVGKIKTALFGGEGLFFAKVTGPGTVWLQSLPFSRLASRVFAAAPQRGGGLSEQRFVVANQHALATALVLAAVLHVEHRHLAARQGGRHVVADLRREVAARGRRGLALDQRGDEQLGIGIVEELGALHLAPLRRHLERPGEQDAGIAQILLLGVRVVVVRPVHRAVLRVGAAQHRQPCRQALLGVQPLGLAHLHPHRVEGGLLIVLLHVNLHGHDCRWPQRVRPHYAANKVTDYRG